MKWCPVRAGFTPYIRWKGCQIKCACLRHVQVARKRMGEDPAVSWRVRWSQELAHCSGRSHHKILESLLNRDRCTFIVGL